MRNYNLRTEKANPAPKPNPAPGTQAKRGFVARLSSTKFFLLSILIHLLFVVGAGVWVVQTIAAKKKLEFKAGNSGDHQSMRVIEHKVSMAKKTTTSPPIAAKRVTTTALSKVTVPDVPVMPLLSDVAPNAMGAANGDFSGLPGGKMGGVPGAGGLTFNMFGFRGSPPTGSLAGTLYDLKQDKSGKPNDMAALEAGGAVSAKETSINDRCVSEVAKFVKSGFSESALSNYFHAPSQLFATQIYIPKISSADGPKAFGQADQVKPKRWIVVYRGKVMPPESGQYRFVGFGDDFLVVRFKGQIVLDGSFFPLVGKMPSKYYFIDGMEKSIDPKTHRHSTLHDARVGDLIDVIGGNSYDIEILIGERPGGAFSACLLLEKNGVEYEKDGNGSPTLPIFKVGRSVVPKATTSAPVFSEDKSWSVWKAYSGGSAPGGFKPQ